jgi:hypothetical protein
MWQDYSFMACNALFVMAQIPTLRHRTDKPPMSSSLMTGALLMVITYTFWSLTLHVSAFSAFVLGIVWFVIAYQKWRIDTKTASQ